jgi:hypothetical protein
MSMFLDDRNGLLFIKLYFQRNKKRRGPREGKCHAKTMMSTKANERLKETLRLGQGQRIKKKARENEIMSHLELWNFSFFLFQK